MTSTDLASKYRQFLFQLRIYPIAVALGLSVGLLASAFVWLVIKLKDILWHQPQWTYSSGVIFAICLTGGLLVGLLNHSSQKNETSAHDLDEVFGEVEYIESRDLPNARAVLRRATLGVTSLGFGGPLGPEAPLIEITSQMSARLASVLRLARFEAVQLSVAGSLGALFGAPLALVTDEAVQVQGLKAKAQRFARLGPEIVAGVCAFIVFKELLPGGGLHSFESLTSSANDIIGINLLWIVTATLLTASAIKFLQNTIPTVRHLAVSHVPGGAIVLGVLSGIVLGIGGLTNKLVLFSGHHEIQVLLNQHSSWKFLVGIALLKVVVLTACLAGGWFGGQIFPMAFIGVALSLAVGDLVNVSASLMLAGVGFVSAITVGLRKPLLSLILGFLFFPQDVWLALAVATAVATVFTQQTRVEVNPTR